MHTKRSLAENVAEFGRDSTHQTSTCNLHSKAIRRINHAVGFVATKYANSRSRTRSWCQNEKTISICYGFRQQSSRRGQIADGKFASKYQIPPNLSRAERLMNCPRKVKGEGEGVVVESRTLAVTHVEGNHRVRRPLPRAPQAAATACNSNEG
jgi:hypothetical protein